MTRVIKICNKKSYGKQFINKIYACDHRMHFAAHYQHNVSYYCKISE